MGLLLALGVLLLTGAGVAVHELGKRGTASAPLLPPSTFEGLEKGHVYRVWAKLDRGYGARAEYATLERDLAERLAELGFSEVILAGEDPTDPRVWLFLARWGQDSPDGVNAHPLAIYAVEETTDPAAMDPGFYPAHAELDAGLAFAESNAVTVALTKERDPGLLFDFAKVLAPDFPVAASLLDAKAKILLRPVTDTTTSAFRAIESLGQKTGESALVSAPPLSKAALLEYRARIEA